MFKNYLMTAYKVYTRRKLFTAINLLCITLTLMVLLVVTALLQNTFFPSGVEGKSDRFLQIGAMSATGKGGNSTRVSPLGYKVIDKYLKPMKSVQLCWSTCPISRVLSLVARTPRPFRMRISSPRPRTSRCVDHARV